ncbi:hypothetical protein Salat_2859400 [Sesamum alatum]|uniref:Uncharacterized protein n=1 Tax=Sesamum alatum TaxID=300844 RepID=A0AAE1XN05_9LAMI|nr:hypothetical protein Salat_2859400 [Sesamum alatum]
MATKYFIVLIFALMMHLSFSVSAETQKSSFLVKNNFRGGGVYAFDHELFKTKRPPQPRKRRPRRRSPPPIHRLRHRRPTPPAHPPPAPAPLAHRPPAPTPA